MEVDKDWICFRIFGWRILSGKKTEEEIGAGLSGWARQLVNLDSHKQTFCQKNFEH